MDTQIWMSRLDPALTLNRITIPGTHDTGTWPSSSWSPAKCQSMTLAQQLDAGIRFLDIRLKQAPRGGEPDFKIHHGPVVDEDLWFSTDIVAVCRRFLAAHPSEAIVVSIKIEAGSAAQFEDHLARLLTPDLWLTDAGVPTLAQARGRIVLFRRYAEGELGIPAPPSGWPQDARGTFVNGAITMHIQDVYGFRGGAADLAKKCRFVVEHLQNAAADPDPHAWWINFTSASGGAPPRAFALGDWGLGGVNATLDHHLGENPRGRLGLVIMDFPESPNDGRVIERLIATNFDA